MQSVSEDQIYLFIYAWCLEEFNVTINVNTYKYQERSSSKEISKP